MYIGVLSDTHNQVHNLQKAVDIFHQNNVELLIHCGDITSVETVQFLCEFRVITVFGNGDFLSGEIKATLKGFDPQNFAGIIYEGEVGEKSVGVCHGHITRDLDTMIQLGRFDYVFTGHTHIRQDERINHTRVINPGALGGLRKQSRSVCIINLVSDEVFFIEIDED